VSLFFEKEKPSMEKETIKFGSLLLALAIAYNTKNLY